MVIMPIPAAGRQRSPNGWRAGTIFAIDPAWVSPTPGVVSGLGLILQAVTEVGDEVVVFPPAYHAFRKIILANERRILDAQLVQRQGRYEMDLDALAKQLTPRTKIVFFCSPHNPGGTVWSSRKSVRSPPSVPNAI